MTNDKRQVTNGKCSAALLHTGELVSYMQFQGAFRDVCTNIFGARFHHAVASFDGNAQRQLRLAYQHQRIHALIDRALHKAGEKGVGDRIHAFKIDTLHVNIAVNDLFRLIERQLDITLRPAFELDAAAGDVVTPGKSHRRHNLTIMELNSGLHAIAFGEQRDRIATPAPSLEIMSGCKLLDGFPICTTQTKRRGSQSVERCRQNRIDKALLESQDD